MADGTNVGKINLEIDLTQDLNKQIDNASSAIGKGLETGVNKGFNVDSLINTFSKKIEDSIKSINNNINSSIDSMKQKAETAINDISDMVKKVNFPQYNAPSAPTSNTRASTVPRSTGNADTAALQIDILSREMDMFNNKAMAARQKVQELKAEIDKLSIDTGNPIENKINSNTIELLKKELADAQSEEDNFALKSDNINVKLQSLTDNMNAGANATNKNANAVRDKANSFEEASNKGTVYDTTLNKLKGSTDSAAASTRQHSSAMDRMGFGFNQIGRILDRMLIRMVLFNTVMKGISAFSSFLGSALMSNAAFSNSLAQVKTNLEVAFMPIYQAILPALTSLMQALATVTTYIAAFISALFGKTYQQSFAAAKTLNKSVETYQAMEKQAKSTSSAVGKIGDETEKAAKKVREALAGFDQINKLSITNEALPKVKTPKEPSISPFGAPMVAPPIDVNPATLAMKKIQDAAEKTRAVLKILIPVIAGVVATILTFKLITGMPKIIENIKNAFSDLWAIIAANPVAAIIALLVGLAVTFAILYATNKDFRDKVNKLWSDFMAFLKKAWKGFQIDLQTDWSKSFGFLGDILNGFFKSSSDIWQGLKEVFQGIIDFIAGVFTGNWARAWNGVKEIFKGVFDSIAGIGKSIMNGIISLINGAISGLNLIHINIPSWVPGFGGDSFGFHLSKIPYLATGGIISQPTLSILGESGKEAVMPLENNTGWIDSLAGKINSKGGNNDQTISLLLKIIDLLKNFNTDINVDGDKLAQITAKQVNKRTRMLGKCEIIT